MSTALASLPAQSGAPTLLPDTRSPALTLNLGFSILYPLGRLSDVTPPSEGPMVEALFPLGVAEGMELGISAGYLALEGREPEISEGSLVPIMASLHYELLRDSWFRLQATAGVGSVYTSLNYDKDGVDVFQPTPVYETESAWQPAASGGLRYRVVFGRLVSVDLGWSYLFILESDGVAGAFQCPIALGIGL